MLTLPYLTVFIVICNWRMSLAFAFNLMVEKTNCDSQNVSNKVFPKYCRVDVSITI